MDNFIGFALFAFVASITPGPNNILLTAVGASKGIWRSLPFLWGIALGFAVMIFVVSVALSGSVANVVEI